MEQLAAHMIPDIQRSYPHGPLVVAGWSLAGVVAIELASQLERAGRTIQCVVLFDSMSPVRLRQWFGSWPLLRQWQLNLLKARYHLEETFTSQRRDPLGYLIRTVRDARSRRHYDRFLRHTAAGRSVTFDVPLDFRHAYGMHAARYAPAPLRAPVLVVRPERQKPGRLFAGDLGWAELGYQVELLTVPGDHERMFKPPNASVLAERVLDKLGR